MSEQADHARLERRDTGNTGAGTASAHGRAHRITVAGTGAARARTLHDGAHETCMGTRPVDVTMAIKAAIGSEEVTS